MRSRGTQGRSEFAPADSLDPIFRALVLQSPFSTWIADLSGTLIFENEANRRLFGISDEQVVGKYNLFEDEEIRRQVAIDQINKAFIEGVPVDVTLEYDFSKVEHVPGPKAEGTKVLRVFLFPIKDSSGLVRYVVVQHEDYTEKKRAEKALEESEEKFRNLVENISDWVWEIDTKACYTYTSPKVHDLLGYEPEEILGKTLFDLMPTEEAQRVSQILDTKYAGKQPLSLLENTLLHKDGHLVVVETSGIPLFDHEGEFLGYRGVDRDITERKHAEEALREERDRAQKYLDVAGVVLVVIDADQKVSLINRRGCNLLGYKEEQIIGKNWFDNFIPEDSRESVRNLFHEFVSGKVAPIEPVENPVLTKSGDIRLISWHNTVLQDENGNYYATLSSGEDITERRQYVDALRYRNDFEQLTASISTSFINLPAEEMDRGIDSALESVGLFSQADRSYVFLLRNGDQVLCNTHEWAAEGIQPAIEELQEVHVDDIPWIMNRLRNKEIVYVPRVSELPKEAELEKQIFYSQNIQSLVNIPMVFAGSLMGFVGFHSVRKEKAWTDDDISLLRIVGEILANAIVRKRTEQALEASEENFRSLFNHIPAGVFSYDRNGIIAQANIECERLWGYPLAELTGRSVYETIVRPQDRANAESVFSRVFAGQIMEDIEWTQKRADGSTIHVLMNTTPIYGAPGKVAMGISLNVDITERKLAEQRERELQEQQMQFYKQTVTAATNGKLAICELEEIYQRGGDLIEEYVIRNSSDISRVRHQVKDAVIEHGMEKSRAENFALCVGEAATNALKHAGGGDIALLSRDDLAVVRVSDHGPGMDALILPRVILEKGYSTGRSLGMGYALILTLADEICLNTSPEGTTVAIEMAYQKRPETLSIEALPDTW